MLHYIVLADLKEHATDEHVAAMTEGYVALATVIPQMRLVAAGREVGSEGGRTVVLTAQFESAADLDVYRTHPDHRAYAQEHVLPFAEVRSVLQFFDDGGPAQ